MRIQIVDDSQDARLLMQAFLKQGGYTDILLAESARMAFEQLGLDESDAEAAVDLILMDFSMPELDGVDACIRLKSVEKGHNVPLIMVTANKSTEDIERAFAAGAMDYISKPFVKEELLARVRSALALKADRDELRKRERELLVMKSQLETANLELERLTIEDGLTKIPNRRHFDVRLASEWARAMRDRVPLSLLMVDVDHFKAINDQYGHQYGDVCLREIAATLAGTVTRATDLVARYGGEEFAVVLANTPLPGALLVAERMRIGIQGLEIVGGELGPRVRVTVSIGVATMIPVRGSSGEELIGAADQAAYGAKTNGRNRVEA